MFFIDKSLRFYKALVLFRFVHLEICDEMLYNKPRSMKTVYAGVAELADALDLGSSGYPRAGSSPVTCTKQSVLPFKVGHFV